MVNRSKTKDQRFWSKWRNSGAVESMGEAWKRYNSNYTTFDHPLIFYVDSKLRDAKEFLEEKAVGYNEGEKVINLVPKNLFDAGWRAFNNVPIMETLGSIERARTHNKGKDFAYITQAFDKDGQVLGGLYAILERGKEIK